MGEEAKVLLEMVQEFAKKNNFDYISLSLVNGRLWVSTRVSGESKITDVANLGY